MERFGQHARSMFGYTPETHADLYALANDLLVNHRASLGGVDDAVTLRLEICTLAIRHGGVGGMRYHARQHVDPGDPLYIEPPPWDLGLKGIPYGDLWEILGACR